MRRPASAGKAQPCAAAVHSRHNASHIMPATPARISAIPAISRSD
jgi:hypothetical protein